MNTFRHSAGFGKRIEYWVIGRMLKEGGEGVGRIDTDGCVYDVVGLLTKCSSHPALDGDGAKMVAVCVDTKPAEALYLDDR